MATTLLSLPEELITRILAELPVRDLVTVARVCRHLQAAVNSPVLWVHLFHSTPGFKLTEDAHRRVVATDVVPGTWDGRQWEWSSTPHPPSSVWSLSSLLAAIRDWVWTPTTTLDPAAQTLPKHSPISKDDSIPVHYPTLYRARTYIGDELKAHGPHAAYDPSGTFSDGAPDPAQDSDPIVYPNFMWMMEAHGGKVYAVAVHGRWAVSGSRDQTLKFWRLPQLPTGDERLEYGPSMVHTVEAAHEGSILCVAFEDDGVLVTGSSDHSAKVWDVDWRDDGVEVKLKTTLIGHTDRVTDIALSKDYIVTCSHDRTTRVYDRTTSALVHILTPHSGPIIGIALNPSQTQAAILGSGPMPGWVTVDLKSGNELTRVSSEPAGCIAWAGQYIACGGRAGDIALYRPDSGKVVREFDSGSSLVRAIRYEPHLNMVVTAGHDSHVNFWDVATGKRMRGYAFPGWPIFHLARDGMNLVAGAGNGLMFICYGVGMPYQGLFA